MSPEDAHTVSRGQVLSIRTHPQGPKPRLALVGLRSVCWPRLLRAASVDRRAVAVQEAANVVVHVDHLVQVLRGSGGHERVQLEGGVCVCVLSYVTQDVPVGGVVVPNVPQSDGAVRRAGQERARPRPLAGPSPSLRIHLWNKPRRLVHAHVTIGKENNVKKTNARTSASVPDGRPSC